MHSVLFRHVTLTSSLARLSDQTEAQQVSLAKVIATSRTEIFLLVLHLQAFAFEPLGERITFSASLGCPVSGLQKFEPTVCF